MPPALFVHGWRQGRRYRQAFAPPACLDSPPQECVRFWPSFLSTHSRERQRNSPAANFGCATVPAAGEERAKEKTAASERGANAEERGLAVEFHEYSFGLVEGWPRTRAFITRCARPPTPRRQRNVGRAPLRGRSPGKQTGDHGGIPTAERAEMRVEHCYARSRPGCRAGLVRNPTPVGVELLAICARHYVVRMRLRGCVCVGAPIDTVLSSISRVTTGSPDLAQQRGIYSAICSVCAEHWADSWSCGSSLPTLPASGLSGTMRTNRSLSSCRSAGKIGVFAASPQSQYARPSISTAWKRLLQTTPARRAPTRTPLFRKGRRY